MPALDTNVLLHWLLDDIPKQTLAADRLIGSGADIVVPDVAVIEAVYVLERIMLLSRETVTQSVEAILALSNLRMDRNLWRATLDDYLQHPKLSITDCFLAAQTQLAGQSPLYTFDRKLAVQLDGVELLR